MTTPAAMTVSGRSTTVTSTLHEVHISTNHNSPDPADFAYYSIPEATKLRDAITEALPPGPNQPATSYQEELRQKNARLQDELQGVKNHRDRAEDAIRREQESHNQTRTALRQATALYDAEHVRANRAENTGRQAIYDTLQQLADIGQESALLYHPEKAGNKWGASVGGLTIYTYGTPEEALDKVRQELHDQAVAKQREEADYAAQSARRVEVLSERLL